MSGPLALVSTPPVLRAPLVGALGMHPELRVRDGVALETLRGELVRAIDARVHSDTYQWSERHAWIARLVEDELRPRLADPRGRRTLWWLRAPQAQTETRRVLAPGPLLLARYDGRHGLSLGADAVPAAVAAGRAWATAVDAVTPDADAILSEHGSSGADALVRLGLAPHAATAAGLDLLRQLPAPTLPPDVDAAFRAWPRAEALLRHLGRPAVHPPSTAPEADAARAVWAHRTGDLGAARAAARRCLAGTPRDDARAEAIDILIAIDEVDEAVDVLQAWRREDDAAEAWQRLMALTDHPVSAALLHSAIRHGIPEIRAAAARWLVSHGLDEEAAETVARTRHVSWFTAPEG